MRRSRALDGVAVHGDHHRLVDHRFGGNVDQQTVLLGRSPRPSRGPVGRQVARDALERSRVLADQPPASTTSGALTLTSTISVQRRAVVQPAEPAQRGEPPDLLPAGRHRVVRQVGGAGRCRCDSPGGLRTVRPPMCECAVRPWLPSPAPRSATASPGAKSSVAMEELTAQPTAPSICSSISRLSSSAYSIGSSRAIGSTNPRTIMAIASSSVSPRLIR